MSFGSVKEVFQSIFQNQHFIQFSLNLCVLLQNVRYISTVRSTVIKTSRIVFSYMSCFLFQVFSRLHLMIRLNG